MNWRRKTDPDILRELGRRIRERRVRKRYKQSDLARRAGININTLQKMEQGRPFNVSSFIQVLRALDELDQLDHFLPPIEISPIEMLESKEKTIHRVRNLK